MRLNVPDFDEKQTAEKSEVEVKTKVASQNIGADK